MIERLADNECMKPRKFYYEEFHYFEDRFLIEWSEHGLELHQTTSCIPFLAIPDVVIHPINEDWDKLVQSLKDLELDPKAPDIRACDGFQVDCHITFRNRLVKFSIISPDFPKFLQFRKLLNDFTICDDYPHGVIETRDDT